MLFGNRYLTRGFHAKLFKLREGSVISGYALYEPGFSGRMRTNRFYTRRYAMTMLRAFGQGSERGVRYRVDLSRAG